MKPRMLLLVMVLTSLTVSAHADPITWSLVNVQFTDGGTASGYITYDFAKHLVLDFQITTTDGTTLGSFEYDPSSAGIVPSGTHSALASFQIFNQPQLRNLFLEFEGDISLPGTLTIDASSLEKCLSSECGNGLRFASGQLTSGLTSNQLTSAPEPWSLVLLGSGLILFKSFVHFCSQKLNPSALGMQLTGRPQPVIYSLPIHRHQSSRKTCGSDTSLAA